MLENIKLLLNITDDKKDNLLNILINHQTNFVVNYTNTNMLDDNLNSIIEQLVIIAYNRISFEGKSSVKVGDISYSFEESVPKHLLLQLNKHRKCKFI